MAETWVQISFVFQHSLMQCEFRSCSRFQNARHQFYEWECSLCALKCVLCSNSSLFFFLFFFFVVFYFFCRCGLFAWDSGRHWLTTRLCSSKDKRFAYFSFHVTFKNAHFTTCYSCTHSHRSFFRLFGCYCCLSLTHFNMLRNAFTIVIRHTRKVALQTAKEKERRWWARETERQREWECSSENNTSKIVWGLLLYSHELNRE